MKARKADLKVEAAALRDQIRDLKENLRAANGRAAHWSGEVGSLRLKLREFADHRCCGCPHRRFL